jgi:WD40 repeat protein
MSANQGTGEVVEKEMLLLSGCFQEPTANKHANGRDWWILLPDNQQSRFYRWLLTPSGLKGPWVQEISNETIDGYWYCGWSEFSPNGERFLINGCRKGVAVYDFDRCTGLLSNQIFIQRNTVWNYCAVFSPNSQFLYTVDTSSKALLQYDLNSTEILESKTLLGTWDGKVDSSFLPAIFGFMQHGPNGKLYVWGGGSSIMHVIDFPDRKGLDCSLKQYAIQLPASCFSANLYYPHYRLGPIDGSSCDSLGIDNLPVALFRYDLEDTLNPFQLTFTDVSSYAPTTWHWSFGDGATSTEVNPVHTYAQGGAYEVCLIVANAFAADTFCRQVQVGATGVHTLPALPHVRVWPNPFHSEIQIQMPALVGVSPEFVLYDLYGRIVKTARLTDFDQRIPAQELPAGMYVWQLRWNGVVTQVGRVVKQ